MKKIATFAALSAAFLAAAPASAQQLPGAVIAVVNMDRATNECNACKTAATALQGQVAALKTLQTQLAAPLEAEQKSIQAAINALNGKEPDAALKARVQAFEKKQADANAQFSAREQAFQANRAYVMEQIGKKMDPVLSAVMTKRNANIIVDSRTTLKVATSVDVTNDVIAQLNASLPSISTTAPAAAKAAPAKPAGR